MTNKLIQWNCRGFKTNFNELLLLLTGLCPSIICLQETFLKPGGVSIVINDSVPPGQIYKLLLFRQLYIKPFMFAHFIYLLMIELILLI